MCSGWSYQLVQINDALFCVVFQQAFADMRYLIAELDIVRHFAASISRAGVG